MTEATAEKPEKAERKQVNRRKPASTKVAHRAPVVDGRDFVVIGHGSFTENILPHWRVMDGPQLDLKTRAEAMDDLKWHREHNPEFDVRVFRLEPVAFSSDRVATPLKSKIGRKRA